MNALKQMTNDQLRHKIAACQKTMQRLELRSALADIPQWEQFRQHVLEDIGEIERKLLTERNDDYAQGRLQGSYDKLQLFAFTREECVVRMQAFQRDIGACEGELQEREKRNFRQPPPGWEPQQPPGGQR